MDIGIFSGAGKLLVKILAILPHHLEKIRQATAGN
jgi:hypothetical protein